MSPLDLSKVQFPDSMDLRTAAIFLGLSEMRIRSLVRDEKSGLKANKVENSWVFAKKDLEAYRDAPRARKSGGGGGTRGEGKKWIIDVKHADLEKVKNALKTMGIELTPRFDSAKMTAYQAKRKAALKAAAAATPATPVATPKK